MSLFRLVPPAGTRVRIGELWRTGLHWADETMPGELAGLIRELTGKKHVFSCGSGRAAQTLILESLAHLSGEERCEVIIPGYTCYSVAASVDRAGLQVRPVDIDPDTMDYDYDRLAAVDFSRVLAINASNLFGIPSDTARLHQLAEKHQVHLIDDAAQVLGVKRDGRWCGTNGTAGFYSLDRGKNLSAWSGGIIVSDHEELASKLHAKVEALPQRPKSELRSVYFKLVVSSILLHPMLYWLPNALPFLRLGETVYDPDFAIAAMGTTQAAAAVTLLPRLEQLNEGRRVTARSQISQIRKLNAYRVPGVKLPIDKVYVRLPVLADSPQHRERVIELLVKKGIKATAMYPGIIADLEALKEHPVDSPSEYPGSRHVAERLFTLPTHGFVTRRDREKMASALIRAAAEQKS